MRNLEKMFFYDLNGIGNGKLGQFKGWFGKSGIKVKCVWIDLDECLGEVSEVKSLDKNSWFGERY